MVVKICFEIFSAGQTLLCLLKLMKIVKQQPAWFGSLL